MTIQNKHVTQDMFHVPSETFPNIISKDALVHYYGIVFSQRSSNACFNELLNGISWQQDQAIIFGKNINTKRKVAWYGSSAYKYTYSNTTKLALPWTPLLLQIKGKVEQVTGETFNACLMNLYHDGSEGMAWHSDAEKDLKPNGAIASLTFGAERKFSFKHKVTQEKIDVLLENGSLLMMAGPTQTHWMHRLPPTTKVSSPRINLTFRTIINQC